MWRNYACTFLLSETKDLFKVNSDGSLNGYHHPHTFSLPPKMHTLDIRKVCYSFRIYLHELIFYSDTAGTNILVSTTLGVESLTENKTSNLSWGNFSANTCIDGIVGDRCDDDGDIFH